MPPLVISAKNLGSFAIEGACRRCLWVGLHVKPLPYQTFPGIFSSIDAYNKRVVHQYFDREGEMPSWLACLGNVEDYVEPPSYHKFSYHEPGLDVTIRGTPDGVLKMRDGSYTIVDYKTAKYTPGQEKLLPMIPPLMRRAREVYDLAKPPEPSDSCRDCSAVQGLTSLLI